MHNQWMLTEACNDDSIHIVRYTFYNIALMLRCHFDQNTQSGTQWDGMRHFGVHGGHNVFYQGYVRSTVRKTSKSNVFISVPAAEFARGHFFISDPDDLKKHGHKIKFGMHSTRSCSLF